jgi:hypothetical protein
MSDKETEELHAEVSFRHMILLRETQCAATFRGARFSSLHANENRHRALIYSQKVAVDIT